MGKRESGKNTKKEYYRVKRDIEIARLTIAIEKERLKDDDKGN